MSKKTDLAASLAETAGSTRRQPVREASQEPRERLSYQQLGRKNTRPITVHLPKQVRDQLKILAVERDTTMNNLIAEAFNDLFAKYGKPEIAPLENRKSVV